MSAIISVSPPISLVKNVLVEGAINPVQYFIFSVHIVKKNEKCDSELREAESPVSKTILEYLVTKTYYRNIQDVPGGMYQTSGGCSLC